MPHMVIFRDAEGRPGYHQADALDDAVRFVEELRNERQATETRVFAMQEIPIEFKTYWRVEVMPAAEPVAEEPAEMAEPVAAPYPPAMAVAPVADDLDDEVEAEPELERVPVPFAPHAPMTQAEPVDSRSRFGLFGR